MSTAKKLWAHQKKGASQIAIRDYFALFFEIGTGKTATTIAGLDLRYPKSWPRVLIICPLTVTHNWRREIGNWSGLPVRAFVVEGTAVACIKILDQAMKHGPENVAVIINYEKCINAAIYSMLKQYKAQCLIVDESHYCKTPTSRRTKLVTALADQIPSRYLLTGTPILQSAMDIWSQYRILDRGNAFGANFFAFRSRFFEDANSAWSGNPKYFPRWRPRAASNEELNKMIYEHAMRAVKDECLDLPPLVEERIEVPLSTEQLRMYKAMERDFLAFVETAQGPKAIVARQAMTKAIRLLQIVCGHVTDDEGQIIELKGVPRVQALADVLESLPPNKKCVIWASFIPEYQVIRNVCVGLNLECVEYHGQLADAARKRGLEAFKTDPKVRIMIANPASAGTGLDGLQVAPYAVYYSRTFNLAHDFQSEGRTYRGGSEIHDKVTRIDIVTPGSIDEKVMAALSAKEDVAEAILSWAKGDLV